MAEKIFEKQANFGWGFSFNMTSKAPAVAKRIWDKYEDAWGYVNDFNDSAIEGILLSVVADDDEKKNGVYFVQRIKKSATDDDAILMKVGSGDIEELVATFNQEIETLKNADTTNKTELEGQITTLSNTLNTTTSQISSTIGAIDEGKTIVDLIDETNSLVSANKTELDGKIATLSTTLNTTTNQISSTIGTVDEGRTVVDLIDETNSLINETNSLVSANKQNIDDNKSTIDAYTVNNKTISTNPVLSSDDLLVGEEYSVLNQKAENVFPGDVITTAISKIEVMLANTTLALTAAINDLETRIGKPTEYNEENGEVISEASGLYKKYEELSQQIETN